MEFIDPRKTPFVPPRTRGELPHLEKPSAHYFVTFRLFDAVVLKSQPPDPSSGRVVDRSPSELMEDYDPPITLGSCALGRADAAEIVSKALRHFDQDRYELTAWCVMPNHVHAVLVPLNGFRLDQILHSWKSFTANAVNKFLGHVGPFWERESFDHLIRSVERLKNFIDYTEENPVEAELCANRCEWLYSSAGQRSGSAP